MTSPRPGPLVSILVPCHNGAPYLREALDSILAQSYPDIEVILLDDASTDETPVIAAEYADRIRYVRQPTNLGIYDTVNGGIRVARGDLIATYHADDIYLPTIVEAGVAYLGAHPEVGAVFASDILVDADGVEYNRLVLPPGIRGDQPVHYPAVLNALLTYKNRFFVCPTAMVRASVYRELGGYRQDRYSIAADLEMWLRISRRFPVAVLEAHLMKYRHFHGNTTQVYNRLRTAPDNFFSIMDECLALDGREFAMKDSLANYEAHRAEDHLMCAITSYIKGEFAEGRRLLNRASASTIVKSRQVQRSRLLVLKSAMWALLRVPRISALADRMHQRWHMKKPVRRD